MGICSARLWRMPLRSEVHFLREGKFYLKTFLTSEINVARITKRFLEGGHEVPISKIVSRYYKSLINASEAISFVDRAYIYDNSIEDHLPRLLYRTTEGKVFKQYTEDVPEWAKQLVN